MVTDEGMHGSRWCCVLAEQSARLDLVGLHPCLDDIVGGGGGGGDEVVPRPRPLHSDEGRHCVAPHACAGKRWRQHSSRHHGLCSVASLVAFCVFNLSVLLFDICYIIYMY